MAMNIKLSFFKAPSPNKSPPSMPRCLMRDAEGKNPLDAEKDFCAQCKGELRGLGFGLRQ